LFITTTSASCTWSTNTGFARISGLAKSAGSTRQHRRPQVEPAAVVPPQGVEQPRRVAEPRRLDDQPLGPRVEQQEVERDLQVRGGRAADAPAADLADRDALRAAPLDERPVDRHLAVLVDEHRPP